MEAIGGGFGGLVLATYPTLFHILQHRRSCKAKKLFFLGPLASRWGSRRHPHLHGVWELRVPQKPPPHLCWQLFLPRLLFWLLHCSPCAPSSTSFPWSEVHHLKTSIQSALHRKPPQGIRPTSAAPISTQGTHTIKKSKGTINTKFRVLEYRGTWPGRDRDRALILVNIPLMFVLFTVQIYCVYDSLKII